MARPCAGASPSPRGARRGPGRTRPVLHTASRPPDVGPRPGAGGAVRVRAASSAPGEPGDGPACAWPGGGAPAAQGPACAWPGGPAEVRRDDGPGAGEDAAVFRLADQSVASWLAFAAVLAAALAALHALWLDPRGGYGAGFVAFVAGASEDPHAVMVLLLALFGAAHSGLAALRPRGEALVGARAFRVLFAGVSLPLAVAAVVYFIDHRYAGVPLWDVQAVRALPGLHAGLWAANFVSFLFLYPATFNLLEIAAVEEPRVHLYETGIMRITRHPQMVGQLLWCLAHTAWIGSSFMAVTSAGLMAHHLFGCWHGDRRLAARHGAAFDAVKARTSVWPFAAVLDGRQRLPPDFHREFLRPPYAAVTALALGTYAAHPLFQRLAHELHW